jgi:hypothetical protein
MKDLGPTMKGRLEEMGSLYMRGNRADADTFLTSQMCNGGLNLIERTTTPEFGVCSSAENPAVYITRNPWNTDYTTCGSSAGSAAMVAAGVVPIAHATDGGGSIRIPTGVNGNIGLKVSRGVFSIAPQFVRSHGTRVHPGLPVAFGARHRSLRRRVPRPRARRIHAVPDSAGASHGADHACVYRKPKPGRSGDGVRLGWGTI